MTASCTDSAVSQQGRGIDRAFLCPGDKALHTLDNLEATAANRAVLLLGALACATVPRLKSVLLKHVTRLNTNDALRVAAELTKRGIAPAFRGLPVSDDPWWFNNVEADFILLACDLQWVAAQYPGHKPTWQRLQPIFEPETLLRTAEYLHWGGQRTAGQAATALALTDDQQRELTWTQCLHLKRWLQRLYKRWPVAQSRIALDVQGHDKRGADKQAETVKRRGELWLCAELGGWRLQRTADLHRMMVESDKPLSRKIVGVQLAKLPRVRRTD